MAIVILPSGDGKIHRLESLQENNTIPSLSAAQTLADNADVLTGNTTTAGGGKFSTFPDDMVVRKPRILLMPYVKGPVWTGSSTPFPESWWCHWGNPISSSNRVCSPQGTNIFIMQPNGTGNFTDTGGLAGNPGAVYASWKAFHAAYVAYQITQYNTHFTGDPLQGAWMDYAPLGGTKQDGTTNVTQVVPGGTTAYTSTTWYPIVNTFIDTVRAGLPAGMFLFVNGIVNNTQLDNGHADGVMYENWLRSATGGALPAACPSDSKFQGYINSAINAQGNSVWFQGYTKLWSSMTTNQQGDWRQFMCAAYLMADNGKCGLGYSMHGASDTPQAGADLDPWDTGFVAGPNFAVNLGIPLATKLGVSGYQVKQGTSGVTPGWLYERRFQNGVVRINTDGNSITQALDRTYQTLSGGAASTTVPGRSAVILTSTIAPIIASDVLDVTGSGAVSISAIMRVRKSGTTAVSGTGVVTVIDSQAGSPATVSGTLGVSGSGSVAISATLKVNVSGVIALGGSSSITVVSPVRVRVSGALDVSASGGIAVARTSNVWYSGSLSVAGSGVVTATGPVLVWRSGTISVSSGGVVVTTPTLQTTPTLTTGDVLSDVTVIASQTAVGAPLSLSGALAVSGSGVVAVSAIVLVRLSGAVNVGGTAASQVTATSGGLSVHFSGALSVVGTGTPSISASLLRAVSGVLSLSSSSDIVALGIIGGAVTSGLLDVSGSGEIEADSDGTGIRHHDSLNPEADFVRRFFH